MSISETNVIDFVSIDYASGDVLVTLTDHLPWDEEDEGEHCLLLQEKFNTYLAYIEGGQILDQVPDALSRKIVINLVGKYPLGPMGKTFLRRAREVIEGAGFHLNYELRSE